MSGLIVENSKQRGRRPGRSHYGVLFDLRRVSAHRCALDLLRERLEHRRRDDLVAEPAGVADAVAGKAEAACALGARLAALVVSDAGAKEAPAQLCRRAPAARSGEPRQPACRAGTIETRLCWRPEQRSSSGATEPAALRRSWSAKASLYGAHRSAVPAGRRARTAPAR